MQKCQELYCPWIQDSRDENHYICLKCQQERQINQANGWEFFLMIFVIVALIALLTSGTIQNNRITETKNPHQFQNQQQ
ncbi:hypothetical protein [Coleofasciculus sp. FACHB-1120]|uniref:hypothetical protein n=1 Tax=Coleofasciculus sp. FACHB-1120 TaxID=2692783 RepID=UPI0016823DED|nr:hypothetical protein [Coleofasciculus sp. FACHB-1120]MBD2744838.1 hypothetical protein [Coleofasciculus sp. FACHB-1120]